MIDYWIERIANVKENFDELNEEIKQRGNIKSVKMRRLRDLVEYFRSGKWACNEIERQLNRLGIGWLPESLPHRQNESVILYIKDSPEGRILSEAIQGNGNAGRSKRD